MTHDDAYLPTLAEHRRTHPRLQQVGAPDRQVWDRLVRAETRAHALDDRLHHARVEIARLTAERDAARADLAEARAAAGRLL